ncbi:hypothetical protein ASZ90_008693 [hydrocarbon metagenome]|uniref:Uncharacterized protein n=1 Tax=hydrocarbon metagenome TaxID=938273 RepID=A0A0W8FKV1_9ZZZZ
MAVSAMATIIPYGIACQQSSHHGRDRDLACSKEKVKVIGDQCPGITTCSGITKNITQAMKELIPVGVRLEYLFPLYAANHNMMDGVCRIYARTPWHTASIEALFILVKE